MKFVIVAIQIAQDQCNFFPLMCAALCTHYMEQIFISDDSYISGGFSCPFGLCGQEEPHLLLSQILSPLKYCVVKLNFNTGFHWS